MKMRKLFAAFLAASLTFSAVAPVTYAEEETKVEEAADAEAAEDEKPHEITTGMCEGPTILTSVGQSADVDIVATLCKKIGLEVYQKATISADELTDQYKTLILAVGGSSKGLGAAGIDADQEMERTNALIEKAKELKIQIIAMHTGGEARRGTLSDSFITPAFEAADIAIVVDEANKDNFISDITDKEQTASAYVAAITDVMTVLKDLFDL